MTTADREGRPADLLPAALLAGLGIIGLSIAALSGPGTSGQYLVIAPPWADRGDTMSIVHEARGQVVDFGGLRNIAIAISDENGFDRALRTAGAWLVMPAPRLFGCFIPTEADKP